MPLAFGPTFVEGKVYRGKKKQEGDDKKQALKELETIVSAKRRQPCDCEAQVHELLENCLECGRLTCEAEGPGKCLSCGNIVLSQEQRNRLMQHLDFLRPTFTNHSVLSGPKTKIIDNQFDHFAIDNKKHLREEERSRMRAELDDLQAKRYQRKLILNIDIDNLEAGSSSMPQIDDYESELRKLQQNDNQAGIRNSTQTLAQLVSKESKKNYNLEYVSLIQASHKRKAESLKQGVSINVGKVR